MSSSPPTGRACEYVSGATIRKHLAISNSTLHNWADTGKIRCVRPHSGTGKRLYARVDVERVFGLDEKAQTSRRDRRKVAYTRVSSQHQKQDLERQIIELKQKCPNHQILSDIGSGLNWRRPKLIALLDDVCRGNVEEVVVAHRDRLARFAVELLEWLFTRHGTRLVVLDKGASAQESEAEELRDDLLAVVTFFVARNNGKRAAANRRRRRQREETADAAAAAGHDNDNDNDNDGKQEEQEERRSSSCRALHEDSRVPNREATTSTRALVRSSAMDVQPMHRENRRRGNGGSNAKRLARSGGEQR